MTSICLIRHGETDWNALGKLQGQTDVPLNKNGRLQAEACGQFLKNFHWDVLITSPLQRALETGTIINKKLDLPLLVMPQFAERFFGDAEGLTIAEREQLFPTKNYPNQEDNASLNERLMAGLESITQDYKHKKVLLVTHGAVIHTLLRHFSNGEIGKKKIRLFNGGLNHIQFDQSEWKIKSYNQVSHLPQL
ncbi:histidine phosphatase family protein [Pullulanibacillus sp. KACC 23026]|uniref:histidine phosphatase family protein n=1 Tax=Pullulanibacillus sp. KACC 23026 TaxID=3028315 RepID=UPI0023AEE281|nr:histidine phosphatase family protein [Pullulanibacillus sp. KACC 23026]WEG11825.1 histidine phosphatase family protein [Pullulanibacillus sp. KACC 23026]